MLNKSGLRARWPQGFENTWPPARIIRRAPTSWRREPTEKGSGWKLIDENGVERVRFMRPDPRSQGVWGRLKLGYWRMQDELGRFLDENGNVVAETDPDFQFKTHIPYTGQ
ncbi:hypothetical protein [Sorangium cellulosum]|uniref:hypothetical protein n=1 Tax=Sorangium cellulosum TaxID=56 RepID=UPI0018F86C2D|nr:hypothetical protein [Sorangium cellulosum]